MALRKSIVTLAVVASPSAASVNQSKAALALPPPPPATSVILGVGGGLAVGIIAAAGLLVIYDLWLKFNGYKNWDGTPKVQAPPPRHVHR
jgi:hypothetical protein